MYMFRFRQQIAWWIQPRFTAVWGCCVLHPFYRLRVLVKTFLRDHLAMGAISSYCRDCGRNVHDFDAPDWAWQQVWGDSGGVLCYDCFSERCHKLGIPPVWSLTNLRSQRAGCVSQDILKCERG